MSEQLIDIDITKTQERNGDEDLIDIEIGQEKRFKVNFSKLVSQSRHVRDKYKYSEAVDILSNEFSQLQEATQVKETSIFHFLNFIQEGKVRFQYEEFHDIYKLSKHFEILQLTQELDEIFRSKMFEDLNFSIEALICSEREKEEIENDFLVKIENFLSDQINECLLNTNFGRLPVSIICQIVDKSDKERLNINALIDFIFESIESRFVLLKFVKLEKIDNENVDKFIQFFDEEEKEKYLEHIPFNLSFIKEMKRKYDELAYLFNITKEELQQTKEELQQTKEELQQTQEGFHQTKEGFQQTQEEFHQTQEGFQQTNKELQENEREIERIEKVDDKQYATSIVAAGLDHYNQLGINPSDQDKGGNYTAINPPQKLPVEPSSLLSYSSYFNTFLITRSGSLQGVGYNENGRMSSYLPKTVIKQFSEILVKDGYDQLLVPVSAVCGDWYTLFMFSKKSRCANQLVFCDCCIKEGSPVFLDIGNKQPLSLFGGRSHSAAITTRGEVIFINRHLVKNSPSARIESSSLPNGEKATSVACCEKRVIALSSTGAVFSSEVTSNSKVLKFSRVEELSDKEIVWVSGTFDHFLAVSKDGQTFGCGSNSRGQLGLGEGTNSVSQFTEISSLFGCEIKSAYAGVYHSLFETREGKILSCGDNFHGELLLSSGPSENVYSPTETAITSGATFCIAGCCHSSVFIGGDPPPNTPNMPIKFNKQ